MRTRLCLALRCAVMESPTVRNGLRRAIRISQQSNSYQLNYQSRRHFATPSEDGQIRAARPIRFSSDRDQFSRSRSGLNATSGRPDSSGERPLISRVRVVPASPSYFTATPRYLDDVLFLASLLQKYLTLPVLPNGQAPRVAWKTLAQYKIEVPEPIREKTFQQLMTVLKRLNCIHPALIPPEVTEALSKFKRIIQPHLNQPKPIVVDQFGRARAVGRRKTSSAAVYLVEGRGEVLINGRPLTEYFGRIHDRESALWPLIATQRMDKYNVWVLTQGGGTTGQAEAITLGLAKALLAHEPDLKPFLRKAGVVTRNPKKVERKKPGKIKARKMPAWNRR